MRKGQPVVESLGIGESASERQVHSKKLTDTAREELNIWKERHRSTVDFQMRDSEAILHLIKQHRKKADMEDQLQDLIESYTDQIPNRLQDRLLKLTDR